MSIITGLEAFKAGKSIHYNPFRDRGTGEQFVKWEADYKAEEKRAREIMRRAIP